jgi:hypothetical protein
MIGIGEHMLVCIKYVGFIVLFIFLCASIMIGVWGREDKDGNK